MTTSHDNPYAQFHFLIDFGDAEQSARPNGAFQELTGIGPEIAVVDYRGGNAKTDEARKLPVTRKFDGITLKRGVIATGDLYRWLDQIRNADPAATRTVAIGQQNENRTAIVRSWKLLGARIVKHTTTPISAKDNHVAIEELVLSCEQLEIG